MENNNEGKFDTFNRGDLKGVPNLRDLPQGIKDSTMKKIGEKTLSTLIGGCVSLGLDCEFGMLGMDGISDRKYKLVFKVLKPGDPGYDDEPSF